MPATFNLKSRIAGAGAAAALLIAPAAAIASNASRLSNQRPSIASATVNWHGALRMRAASLPANLCQ